MQESVGVLVGCDQEQEWLLSWWYSHFRKTNPLTSVAFADFGMSPQAREWCQEKGQLISIAEQRIATPETLDPSILALWEKIREEYGEKDDLWIQRRSWFKKPLAMANTPFYRTLWLDMDCEVRGDLTSLINLPLSSVKLSAVPLETALCFKKNEPQNIPAYNSGVVLFEKDSSLLALWNKGIEEGSRFARTDDELLSFLVDYFQITVNALPNHSNWEILKHGPNADALIYHWMGEQGKKAIRLMDTFNSAFY